MRMSIVAEDGVEGVGDTKPTSDHSTPQLLETSKRKGNYDTRKRVAQNVRL
jgi:hypothetical protein